MSSSMVNHVPSVVPSIPPRLTTWLSLRRCSTPPPSSVSSEVDLLSPPHVLPLSVHPCLDLLQTHGMEI